MYCRHWQVFPAVRTSDVVASLRSRFPFVLLAVYVVIFVLLAISPRDRHNWYNEVVLAVLFVALLVATFSWFRFSDFSYSIFFVFLVLHTIAAHYGYSHVPLDWESWGFSRNHSDRVQHFLFGLMMVLPARELLVRKAKLRGFWSYYLAFAMILSFSALYEIIEWLAVVYEGKAGQEFLGSQGDAFDAYKDMALAAAASVLVLVGAAVVETLRCRRNVRETLGGR